jgi:hypothetical protein
MSARRRTTTWMFTGLIGLAATAGLSLFSGCGGGTKTPSAGPSASTDSAAKSPLATLADRLRRSDADGLTALAQALEKAPETTTPAISDAEAAEWLDVLAALRAGFLRFPSARDRTLAVTGAQHILDKFAVEPAPASWLNALIPLRDILCTGLIDRDIDVRVTSLAALGKIWSWYPGRSLIGVEETTLADWKNAFHSQVLPRRGDRDPKGRAAAVACLASIPLDNLASPAVACLEDATSGLVRHQVLVSFANRPTLLTDEMILKHLHDAEPGIPQLAELILKTRGLTRDQVALGRLITSPKPELRASVIPLLREHDDIDPVVWLLRLSHDTDELVRTKAVEAMTGRTDAEVRERLREMASKDESATVRAAASKLVLQLGPQGKTVALPPLPGSPSLTPKAN